MSSSRKPEGRSAEYLPMTYGQKWCMGEMTKIQRPGWYSIEFVARTKVPMHEQAMSEAVSFLVHKYESLRVRIRGHEGEWIQEVYPLPEADPYKSYDLSGEGESSRPEKMKEICITHRDGVSPEAGNLLKVLFFKFSATDGRLWFYFHHLVSDFVSVLIFSSEFMATYNSLLQGKQLLWQTAKDYRKWLYMVEGYCRDILLPAELDYWSSLPWDKARILPSDYPDTFYKEDVLIHAIETRALVSSYREETHWLTHDLTSGLFAKAGWELEHTLIAVFCLAVAGARGMDFLDINVCNSGRNILPPDYGINVNNLIGFLATTRAVLLRIPGGKNLLSDIENIVQQIKDIPNAGIGYILISGYIKDEQVRKSYFDARQKGSIFFNYLGRVNTNFSNGQFEIVAQDTGAGSHPAEIRSNLLSCDVGVKGNQLFLRISYSVNYFKVSTMEAIIYSMMTMFREIVSRPEMEKVA